MFLKKDKFNHQKIDLSKNYYLNRAKEVRLFQLGYKEKMLENILLTKIL